MIKKYIVTMIFFSFLILPYQVSKADIKLDYENFKPGIEKIRQEEKQKKVETIVNKVIKCESPEGKHDVWGDKHYIYPAYGILQFQRRTFYWLVSISGKKGLNWKKKDDQIELAKWAIENNQGELWTCYRILLKKGEI